MHVGEGFWVWLDSLELESSGLRRGQTVIVSALFSGKQNDGGGSAPERLVPAEIHWSEQADTLTQYDLYSNQRVCYQFLGENGRTVPIAVSNSVAKNFLAADRALKTTPGPPSSSPLQHTITLTLSQLEEGKFPKDFKVLEHVTLVPLPCVQQTTQSFFSSTKALDPQHFAEELEVHLQGTLVSDGLVLKPPGWPGAFQVALFPGQCASLTPTHLLAARGTEDPSAAGSGDGNSSRWKTQLVVISSSAKVLVLNFPSPLQAIAFHPGNWASKVSLKIGGLDQEISVITKEASELFTRTANSSLQGGTAGVVRGALIHGGSGLGKSSLAWALASTALDHDTMAAGAAAGEGEGGGGGGGTSGAGAGAGAPWWWVGCAGLVARERGAAEAALRAALGRAAAAAAAPPRPGAPGRGALLVLDGAEACCPRPRGAAHPTALALGAVLLEALDRWRRLGIPVFVLATVTDPTEVDPALLAPGRLTLAVALRPPCAAGRRAILEGRARGLPLPQDPRRRAEVLDGVALRAHGYSGADLERLCAAVLANAFKDANLQEVGPPHELGLEDFLRVLEDMPPSSLTSQALYALERPKTRFSDVGGLKEAIETLKAAVLAPLTDALNQSLAGPAAAGPKGPGGGPGARRRRRGRAAGNALLHGPPGGGKTLLARALAGEAAAAGAAHLLPVDCARVVSKYVGETEKTISKIFSAARDAAPCILLLDQIETIGARRGYQTSTQQTFDRVLSTLLVELDGLASGNNGDVVVVACTNQLQILDPALLRPGRFDHHILVPEPDREGCAAIFKLALKKLPVKYSTLCKHLGGRHLPSSGEQQHQNDTTPMVSGGGRPIDENIEFCCQESLADWLTSAFFNKQKDGESSNEDQTSSMRAKKPLSAADISQICQQAAMASLREKIENDYILPKHFL